MYRFTDEDKKYFKKFCLYLTTDREDINSVEITEWLDNYDFETIKSDLLYIISRGRQFDSRYRIEIPGGFKEIISRVINNIDDFDEPDIYEISQVKSEIIFDCSLKKIAILLTYYFYDQEDTSDIYEEEPEIVERLESLGVNKGQSTIQVNYNGGGDSGWLEGIFDNGVQVPHFFEDWCYNKLNRDFSGWEIDGGSQGYFVVNFPEKTVEIIHSENTERAEEHVIYKMNFQ